VAISERTRKLLWGQAASRCAVCRCELVMAATAVDREAIIGEECHIASAAPAGPRSADKGDETARRGGEATYSRHSAITIAGALTRDRRRHEAYPEPISTGQTERVFRTN